jgi:hypothetical protein
LTCQGATVTQTHYVLIDFENVQPVSLHELKAVESCWVLLFVGAAQAKLPFELATAMQALGERGQYIKISGHGANALDFHIAFYIGQIAAREPTACFDIVSKDAGFDSLIEHLKLQNIAVTRVGDVQALSILKSHKSSEPSPPGAPNVKLPKPSPKPSAVFDERLTLVIADLKRRGVSKPTSLKTLTGTIRGRFQKKLSEQEVAKLLAELQARGIVNLEQDKVRYKLP